MQPRHRELLARAREIADSSVKVEFSGDFVIMQAPPSAVHQRNLYLVARQFDAHLPEGYLPSQNTDLEAPAVGKLRNPDLTYLPEDAMNTTDSALPAELALIAVEVVSPSNPENDWEGKVRDYPLMAIPLYLLVDARQQTVTLLSEPENGRYRRREDAAFGEDIHIPQPFSFTLGTAGLLPC